MSDPAPNSEPKSSEQNNCRIPRITSNDIDIDPLVNQYSSFSLNATPVNQPDRYLNANSINKVHRHCSKCFICEVFCFSIGCVLNKKILRSSMNNLYIPQNNYLKLNSVDDGYQDDSPSPLRSSECSERDRGAFSDTSSEGFHANDERTDMCNEGLCHHVEHFLHRLRTNFYVSLNDKCSQLPSFDKPFYSAVEQLLSYFEERYNSDSSEWLRANVVQINNMDLIDARIELTNILTAMFNERVTWGRVVVMIGFVSELSLSAFVIERYDLIEEYVNTSVRFVDDRLWNWISQHGGWEGLIDFQSNHNRSTDFDSVLNSLSRIASVAAIALAGVAFCKYIADHI